MVEDKLACLFKTKDGLEIHIFNSTLHAEGPKNAYTKYENKELIKEIKFNERLKNFIVISNDFAKKYSELHKDREFSHFGYSSDCKYSFSEEEKVRKAFEEFFSNYKNSLP